MRRMWARFLNLFRQGKAESEMSREIEAHLGLIQEDFERRGMSREEAALAARKVYGGVEQAKEMHREARSLVWIEQFFKDLCYAWAGLRRNPGFTLTAMIALALGIGANATVFGVYNAIALKMLPVADPDRVVHLERWYASGIHGNNQYNFAYPEYEYLRRQSGVFSSVIAAAAGIPVLAELDGLVEQARGYAVSGNYFSDLGVKPVLGRAFLPEEDQAPGANPVVVLDYRYWQRKFHGDREALGKTIALNGVQYTIIGVAPPEFRGTEAYLPLAYDFFAPLSMLDQLDPTFGPEAMPAWRGLWRDSSTIPGVELMARLKPGISREQAQTVTDLMMRQYLSHQKETDRTTKLELQKAIYFGSTQDPRMQAAMGGIMFVVSLVLVVACANVANMLLARGSARRREIGIRLALGAGRGRVMRQLLAESLLLALFAGFAGVVLSVWAGKLVWVTLNGVLQSFHVAMIDLDLKPDFHVLLYSFTLSVFTGLCFGLAPALRATRAGLLASLKEDVPGGGPARSRLRSLLLGTQVTVSVLLLLVGLALAGDASSQLKGDLGFDAHDTYSMLLNARPDQTLALRQKMDSLPELAGTAIGRPPLNGTTTLDTKAGATKVRTLVTFASDGYLETLKVALLSGRSFTRSEVQQKLPVAVVSESTAKHLWPGRNPLGERLSFDLDFHGHYAEYQVIGVARDGRFANIGEVDPLHAYLPSADVPVSGQILFRVGRDRTAALRAVRSAVQSADPGMLPSLNLLNLENGIVAAQRGLYRAVISVTGIIAVLSLALAGIGIYGVMAFLVSQRTREIGILVTLGATRRAVLAAIVKQGLRPVFVGLVLGFGLGVCANVIERSAVPFPEPLAVAIFGDPRIYAGLAVMLAVAVVASIVPATRALRVDPAVALRYD